jgi:hypothetical protein
VIVRWEAGRAEVDALIAERLLERVHADRRLADLYVHQATDHLAGAVATIDIDAVGSFQLAYDGLRKALAAILENQGLRSTTRGGHRAVEDALRAQLVPPLGELLGTYRWARLLRNDSEYPTWERATADRADAERCHRALRALLTRFPGLLDSMPVY